MPKLNIEELIESLTRLNKANLKKIKDRVDFLLLHEDKESNTELEIFYMVLGINIYAVLKVRQLPFNALKSKRRKTFKKLCEVHEAIIKMLSNTLGHALTKVELRKWYNIFCDVMIKDFEDSPIPLNLDTLLNSYNNFPGLFDKAYPDYIRSGMVRILLEI